MNDKNAKRLRTLTRLFVEKGVIDGAQWARYGHLQIAGINAGQAGPVQGPTVLDPKCPKGVYRELKRRAKGRRMHPLPWDGPVTPAKVEPTEPAVESAPL